MECGKPVFRQKAYCARCYQNVRRGIPTDVINVPTREECDRAVDAGVTFGVLYKIAGR